ncbi:MAG TPA: four-helix bundle copper-binding protein [Egibacteraceae bacterium]|nr:four-helix bundle copper-binding protein [Actinomycetota bacterium]HWB71235.1 four-helix bundle copper-binding protein [Egibacteraceae bacterium]
MSYARQMLDTYPRTFNVDAGVLAATIDALNDCAQACTACADDCLSEQNLQELAKCIRLNLDCADVCTATARVVSRQTEYDANVTKPLLQACAGTCRSCGDECERHAGRHEHCRVCAEACRRCEQACNDLLAAMK